MHVYNNIYTHKHMCIVKLVKLMAIIFNGLGKHAFSI